MQDIPLVPTQSIVKAAQFRHADNSVDTGFGAPITFTADKPELLKLIPNYNSFGPNTVQHVPQLPAASVGGVVTITGTFINENGALITQQYTVTITPTPNPAVGFVMQ